MRKLLIISGALALIGGASAAQADSLGRPCTDKPEGQYLSLDTLKAKVVEQGYEIRSGSIKEACGEFYVLDKAGKRAELFLDPTTGIIVAGGGQAAGEAANSDKAAATDSKDADGDKVGEADEKSGDKDKDDN
jgi:hypothetical protein